MRGQASEQVEAGAAATQEVGPMPMYEYKCLDCGKEAILALSLKEHDSGSATCPSCKSKRMEQRFTGVMAKTSRKS
jgi:putative FmdB family regulatory protein